MATPEERGFLRTLRLQGRDLKHLQSGATFRGTVNRVGAYELSLDSLGSDPRGKRILETPANGCPALASQDTIQDLASQETFVLTKLGLDCPSYSKKFEMMQQTEKDQT